MTPAVNLAKKLRLEYRLHTYEHEATVSSYGLEAAEKLAVEANCVFKTLVVMGDNNQLAVAILPVSHTLSFKKMAKALGCKKIAMAEAKTVERSTGYVLGGVSPLGQKKRLPTVIDNSAQTLTHMFISGGKRGLEIELSPAQLATTLSATFYPIIED